MGKKIDNQKKVRLIVGIVVLLLLLSIAILRQFLTPFTSASWFDDAWQYRKRINIASHSALENNVYVTVPSFDATDTAKFQSDCGNIRFTKENGQVLPFFAVDCDATANIHVFFDSLPAGESNYYMYYGNINAPDGFFGADFASAASGLGSLTIGSETQGLTPMAYWNFDEGYGTTAHDSSPGQKTGTLSSGASWKSKDSCISGGCIYFDGTTNGKVTVTNGLSLANQSFSFSFWARWQNKNNLVGMINQGPSNTDEGLVLAFRDTNVFTFAFWGDDQDTTTTYNSDTWTFYSGSYNASTNQRLIYADGKLVSSGTAAADYSGTGDLCFGVGCTGAALASNPFKGYLDEIKFYNYVRTADQIKTDYINRGGNDSSAGRIGPGIQKYLSDGLVGYWKMDESSGNVTDYSGNGLTLTNNGTTTFVTGKFANGSEHVPASTQYLSTATTISGIKSVSFWTNPDSTTNYYISLSSSAYITSSSGTISATGFTSPTIYVNGVISSTLIADSWQLVTVTTDTAINADTFYIGRQGSNYYDGTMDDVRVYNRQLTSGDVNMLYTWAPLPIGYWNFDENTGTTVYDHSTTGNNSSSFSGNAYWVAGKYGSSVEVEAASQITVGDPADGSLDFGSTEDFTMMGWIKSTTANSQIFVNKNLGAGSAGYRIRANSSSFASCDIGDTGGQSLTAGTTSIADGKWHHIACVRSGSTATKSMKTYVDGVLQATQTDTIGDLSNTGNFRLAQGWPGNIDEVKFYRYARTASQIMEDLNGGHPIGGSPIASQLLYWNFDEGYGTAADNIGTAGSGSNGTLTSMASPATTTSGWTRTGKLNSGLLFDGSNDNVALATASDTAVDFNGTEAFSGSAWVYITTMPGTNEMDAIITKWDATTPTRGYRLVATNDDADTTGNIRIEIYDESTDQTISAASTTDSISVNTWYHIAFSFNGGAAGAAGDLILYVDGKLAAQNSLNASFLGLEDVTSDFTVGDYDTTDAVAADTALTGTIDEVKIYSGVITPNQVMIDRNYNSAASISNGTDEKANFTDGAGTAPLIYWNFDENTGTSTVSNKGYGSTTVNNGTLTAFSLSDWMPGKIGSALYFDRTDNIVELADTADLTPTTISTSVWIKPTVLSSTLADIQVIYEHDNSTNPFEAYSLYMDTDDRLYCKFCNTSNTCAGPGLVDSLSLNTWYHVACVWDGSTVRTYLNGVARDTASLTGSLKNGNGDFTVGNGDSGDGGFANSFGGLIDDFKLYGYTRTQSQVAQDYNRGRPLAWYKFDECLGTTTNDATGNGYSGTWNGTGAGSQTAVGTCSTASTAWGNGVTGKWNSSLNFDGTDDYVQVTDNAALRFNENTIDFSVFAWIKRTTTGEMNIISKEDADNDGWRLQITSTNTVRCSVNSIDVDSSSTITDTNWHFVGCSITRAGNGQVYIDGIANGTATAISSTTMATTSNIRIGTRSYTSTNYFSGQIDDVRLYYYSLSATQIKLLLNNDSPARFGPLTGTPSP